MNKYTTYVAVIDILGLTADGSDAILRKMGVERIPALDSPARSGSPGWRCRAAPYRAVSD